MFLSAWINSWLCVCAFMCVCLCSDACVEIDNSLSLSPSLSLLSLSHAQNTHTHTHTHSQLALSWPEIKWAPNMHAECYVSICVLLRNLIFFPVCSCVQWARTYRPHIISNVASRPGETSCILEDIPPLLSPQDQQVFRIA